MGSILGVANATGWYSTKNDVNSGGSGGGTKPLCNDIFSDTGSTIAANQALVEQWNDISGSGHHATQTTSGSRPYFRQFDGLNATVQAGVEFNGGTSCLVLPSGVTIGNGSPANEGTIIIASSAPQVGNGGGPIAPAGFPVGLGGKGLWITSNTPTWFNGGENLFNYPNTWSTLHPFVWGLRFKSGESRYYSGLKYTDVLSTNYGTSLAGGFIGCLNSNFYYNGILHEVMIFNQALSDSNMTFLLQWAQDRVGPGYTNTGQLVFFGDSRTRGYNSVTTFGFSSMRSWPAKLVKMIGGQVRTTMMAYVGDTVSGQITKITAAIGTSNGLNNSVNSKNVWIGEVGINDIIAGTSAATIYSNLVTLWSYILANGGTKVIALTVAPATTLTTGQETVRQQLNALILATNTTNVAICPNASDTRLSLTGYPDTDGLHWQDAGYSVYALNAYPYVLSAFGLSNPSNVSVF